MKHKTKSDLFLLLTLGCIILFAKYNIDPFTSAVFMLGWALGAFAWQYEREYQHFKGKVYNMTDKVENMIGEYFGIRHVASYIEVVDDHIIEYEIKTSPRYRKVKPGAGYTKKHGSFTMTNHEVKRLAGVNGIFVLGVLEGHKITMYLLPASSIKIPRPDDPFGNFKIPIPRIEETLHCMGTIHNYKGGQVEAKLRMNNKYGKYSQVNSVYPENGLVDSQTQRHDNIKECIGPVKEE